MGMNYQILLRVIRNEPDVITAFYLYISALKGVHWSRFQIQMCLDFIRSKGISCLNWCRAAGKTEKCSILAVFFLIRGEEVYWYASSTKQLVQAMKYWADNPFVDDFTPNRTRTQIQSVIGDVMGCACLSVSNASGPRAGVVFWDEVALMKKEELVKSFGVAAHVKHPRFLMFSTPVLESIFHDYCRKYGENIQTIYECDWMNHREIESLKVRGLEYLWDQEYLCKWTNPADSVFPPDHIHLVEMTQQYIKSRCPSEYIRQGVDFGGGKGHNLCRVCIRKDAIYVLKEEKFQYKYDDEILQARCDMFPTEVEEGGWNDTFAPNLRGVAKLKFTIETKAEKIRYLLTKPIYIDKALCPNTLKELRKAMWVQKGNQMTVETNELDYLSALMHAVRNSMEDDYDIARHDDINDGYDENPFAPLPF